jgi:uracil phosphoribosyltransferase
MTPLATDPHVRILAGTPTIANHFLAEMRDVRVQRDSLRFRRNMERLGEILAYHISGTLRYEEQTVQTPLAQANVQLLAEHPVLATVLRAGLPFHQGFLNYFDQSPSAFVAAYRVENSTEMTVHVEYVATPSLEGRTLILVDPMLATGTSLALTYREMLRFGTPRQVHIASIIAAPEGVAHLRRTIPEATLWVAALDERLNDRNYIVPGLGDAGDLAYGSKLS